MSAVVHANAGVPRPSVIQYVLKDVAGLAGAHMPIIADGGLFVPTTRDYRLGDTVYVLITLPDDLQRYPVAAKVIWVTPASASGGRPQGVGIRLPQDEKSVALKQKIEATLRNFVGSERASQTL